MNVPSCKNCIYYKPSIQSNDFTSSLSKCEKFGSKDIVTDEITYDYASSCRNDESLCGKQGTYFELDKNIEMKTLKYVILGNIPNIIMTSTICVYCFFSLYIFTK
jgi:hypothetical protein